MENKRVLIAVVLTFFIFFGYQKMIEVFYPNYDPTGQKTSQEETLLPEGVSQKEETLTNAPQKTSSSALPVEENIPDNTLFLETNLVQAEVSSKNASLTGTKFKAYHDHTKDDFREFTEGDEGEPGIGQIDLWVDGAERPAFFKSTLSNNTLSGVSQNKYLKTSKEIIFNRDSYGSTLNVDITNTSSEKIKLQFRVSAGSSVSIHNAIDHQYVEANWIFNDGEIEHINPHRFFFKMFRKPSISENNVKAASIKSRHFSSILKPLGSNVYFAQVEKIDKKERNFASYLISKEITLSPGESFRDSFLLFLGPNRMKDVEPFELQEIITFGKLNPIAKILIGGLQMLQGIFKNYGLAILALTLIINLILMPLTKTSFVSMRRMQLVQPEMMKIRERFKNDPVKMNHEMTALYRKHKVNPLGGCLPLILQMPIFIALYVSLSKSTELLGSSFLWIKDLASPENIPLPFSLPLIGNTINILPIVMVFAMVIQQKISMANMPQTDPRMAQQQKMMLIFMPIFFGFIFYPMPSGLVMYWLTNTIIMGLYQAYLRRSNPSSAKAS